MREIHPSARKLGITDEDIEHAVTYAIAIDDTHDDARPTTSDRPATLPCSRC